MFAAERECVDAIGDSLIHACLEHALRQTGVACAAPSQGAAHAAIRGGNGKKNASVRGAVAREGKGNLPPDPSLC